MREKGPQETDEWKEAWREAGPVECIVCGTRFEQGNKGQTLNVCMACLAYVCNEHLDRHPNCEEGR